jgi:sulfur-carrier protein
VIRVTIQYFAILREERGLAEEALSTGSTTAEALYGELAGRHRFSLPASRIRAAVNGEFVPFTTLLRDGDTVVFIPPVAGG